MSKSIKSLIDEYTRWLRDGISVNQVGDAYEVTTPFLDRHNDHIQIYVRQEANRTLLSDDGYVISDLRQSGCTLDSEHRNDVRASRAADSQMYTMLNDFEAKVPGEVVDALKQYDIVAVPWSQRMDHRLQLAA